jgi:putative ABC transport system substrate-binding protein
MIPRREFITLLGGAAAWPLAAGAQQAERVWRIGVLIPNFENDPEARAFLKAFQGGLQTLGWIEGRDFRLQRAAGPADPSGIRARAAELVASAPDVILTGSNLATAILGRQTRTIPIVLGVAGDAVGTGLVPNMAHPGGNITGFTAYEVAIGGKRLGLLKELAPQLKRVAVVYTQGGAGSEGQLHSIEDAAPSFEIRTTAIPALSPSQIEHAISEALGLAVPPSIMLRVDEVIE